jgi:hypothetical protein
MVIAYKTLTRGAIPLTMKKDRGQSKILAVGIFRKKE